MTPDESGKPARGRKRWRWLRRGCWLLFILWFGWFAYVRITTPPAALTGTRATDRAAAALHTELDQLIHNLPPAPLRPPSSAPTARGWAWWMPPTLVEGLTKAWDPQNHADQQLAAQYVTGPAESSLDRIVKLVEECRRGGERPMPPKTQRSTWGPFGWTDENALVAALTFRARYRASEKADTAGALKDLRTAFLVAVRPPQALDLSIIPQYELGCLLQEIDLPARQAAEMVAFLRDELTLSVTTAVQQALNADENIDRLLDRYYTRDEDGDGWLLLSAAAELESPLFFQQMTSRSRSWNLLSPLFHGRATIRRKLTRLEEDLRGLDTLSYDDARARFSGGHQSTREVSVLDGPFAAMTSGIPEYMFQVAFSRVMRARATTIMLGLSAYKHQHGRYPAALEELVPDFLDELPLDAVWQTPFVYERLTESTCDLKPTREIPGELVRWWVVGALYRPDSYLPTREVKSN